MTKQLEKVKEFMKGKEKVHYNEVSEGTGINKNSVRAIFNISVKFDKDFIRLGDGYYKLK